MNHRNAKPRGVLKARRAEARGLPAQVPIEAVESIPLVGRTWYTRQTSYYLLRALGTVLWLPVFAFFTLFEVMFFVFAAEIESPIGRAVALGLLAAILVESFVAPVKLAIKFEILRKAGLPLSPDYSYEDLQDYPYEFQLHISAPNSPAFLGRPFRNDQIRGALLRMVPRLAVPDSAAGNQ